MNILFTSVGRRVELLRAFRAAMGRLGLSGRLIAVDVDPLAPAVQEADVAELVPRVDEPGFIPQVMEICRRYAIDLVFPLIDAEIPVLAAHRHALEATGARVVLIPDRGVRIASDKLQTYRFFRDLGVPTVCTWTPEQTSSLDEFPVFVKPRFGSAGRGTFEARDRRELDFFLDYVGDPIVQEFLPGPEITSDVICDLDGGGTVLAVVSRQRIEVRSGEVQKGFTILDRRVIDGCVAIASALEAIGPITVQCMRRDEELFFTEVNARFGGGVPLSFAAGVPAPEWLLARAAGIDVDVPPLATYETGLYLSRYDESVFRTEAELSHAAGSRL
jgi:carbamoyl-phosphate synthase large subunit